ncbi:unnamed protein product [Withania somnifera]
MLCRMLRRKRKTGVVPVYLSVYDLTPINGYAYWLGLGVYHSGVIGRTDLGPKEVRAFMEKLAEEYSGNSYNLITKNCNHFCGDVCVRLTGKPIPRWVNRLARLGFLCNCVLPASLNETKVRHIRAEDRTIEKKKLRSHSSRFIASSNAPSLPTRHSGSASSSRQRSRYPPSVPLIRSTSPSVLKLL